MRLRIIGLFFLLGLIQLLLLPQASNAQSESVSNSVVSNFQAEEPQDQIDDLCQVTVLIRGGGSVQAVYANGRQNMLTSYNNPVDMPCGEALTLKAEPSELWQFERWEGLPEGPINEPTITVSAGQTVKAVFSQIGLYYERVETPYYDRNGRLTNLVPKIRIPDEFIIERDSPSGISAAPEIDVWYGDNQSIQSFGQIGRPQKYINILGNVSDPDVSLVTEDNMSLSYSLNGGSVPLNFGSDGRRLQENGDFNIDIEENLLLNGENTVLITATDNTQNETELAVTVNYNGTSTWPLPYYVDWDATDNIQDAGQVVDGDWSVQQNGIRTEVVGYDRVVAIGDQTWTDYEAQVEIQVLDVDPRGFDPGNAAPAIGVFMHWTGHTDSPPVCDPTYRPKCGWLPAIASWYEWDKDQMGGGQFSMWLNHNQKKAADTTLEIDEGEKYIWKIRVESSTGANGKFKFKAWNANDPDGEPTGWFKEINGQEDSPQAGSILLAAHYVDMTFGNVTITPINGGSDTTAPEISDLTVSEEPNGATVHWKTDEPATSTVNFGKTAALGQTETDSSLKTEHYIYLEGLEEQVTYQFEVLSSDNSENTRTVAGNPFTTQAFIALNSDDFNYCDLDPAWEFFNPQNDSEYALTSTELNLAVPGGTAHDIWTEQGQDLIRAPRMMQVVTDPANLQVKFNSAVNEEVQFQGILFEEDENNLFRVSFQFTNGNTELYVIGHRDGGSKILKKVAVNGASGVGPLYLWNTRQSGQWRVRYSTNGTQWSDAGFFDFPLAVTQGGIFAGNVSGPSEIPPVNAQVDYWFDADNPINPEDDTALVLPVNVQGDGNVAKSVQCGNPVTLTATADPGWRFVRWSGSPIDGITNPQVQVFFDFGDQVTAVFEENEDGPFAVETNIVGQGSIGKNPNKSLYDLGETVTLTAQPNAGWQFDHWEGALTGNQASQTLTMDSNKSVTAVFVEKDQYTIQIDVFGSGSVDLNPNKAQYDFEEQVQLTAIAYQGWRFVRWEGDVTGNNSSVQVEVTDDMVVKAFFVQVFDQPYFVHLPFIRR